MSPKAADACAVRYVDMPSEVKSSESTLAVPTRQAYPGEPSSEEWRRRLTVKVEPVREHVQRDRSPSRKKRRGSRTKTSPCGAPENEDCQRESQQGKGILSRKVTRAERALEPKENPVYKAVVRPSEMPLGYSKVLQRRQDAELTAPFDTAVTAEHARAMEFSAEDGTGHWRRHMKCGVAYRKGPFTCSEKMLIEEALQQYAEKEGYSSIEEAFKRSASAGKSSFVPFHEIAKCLPERPIVSIYGYIRRKFACKSRSGTWTTEEVKQLVQLNEQISKNLRGRWVRIAAELGRSPADVRDKWRSVQPRLEAAKLSCVKQPLDAEALEERNQCENESKLVTRLDPLKDALCVTLTKEDKKRLLEEIQRDTGELLPACGIPWQRIQSRAFPQHHHAQLRQSYFHSVVPGELRRRMGTKARAVLLRHLLRALQKLQQHELLVSGLEGVQWLQLLPFVPVSLQLYILKKSIRSHISDKNISIEQAVSELVEKMGDALLAKRKSDARLLLRGVLPPETQQSIEAAVRAEAIQKGWNDGKTKRRIRRKILNAAKSELERLKARNRLVLDAPLNAPQKTCCEDVSQQIILATTSRDEKREQKTDADDLRRLDA